MARAINETPQDGVILSVELVEGEEYEAAEGMLFDSEADFTEWFGAQDFLTQYALSTFRTAFVRVTNARITEDGIDADPVEQVRWFVETVEAA